MNDKVFRGILESWATQQNPGLVRHLTMLVEAKYPLLRCVSTTSYGRTVIQSIYSESVFDLRGPACSKRTFWPSSTESTINQ